MNAWPDVFRPPGTERSSHHRHEGAAICPGVAANHGAVRGNFDGGTPRGTVHARFPSKRRATGEAARFADEHFALAHLRRPNCVASTSVPPSNSPEDSDGDFLRATKHSSANPDIAMGASIGAISWLSPATMSKPPAGDRRSARRPYKST